MSSPFLIHYVLAIIFPITVMISFFAYNKCQLPQL